MKVHKPHRRKAMKRLTAIALALSLALMLSACGGGNGETESTAAGTDVTYTYNTALSTFPTNWNPHICQTATDSQIKNWITAPFYVFDYNETGDGYALIPGAAADYPEDVTVEYIGRFGLTEGEKNRAWKIPLRRDLKWEDGTPITAHDYVGSYQRLLSPEARNYRADGLYSGSLVIHNAEKYLKSGGEIPWEEVGIFAPGEYELVFVLDKPLSGFYLHYALTDSYLVNLKLYDACASTVDGVYTNTYGTSAETTMSCGPYRLTSFQADKRYVLERNDSFYGLTPDTYQTTAWVVDYVPEASTRLALFLQGKLDEYPLTADDMEDYALSEDCYHAPGESTFAMAFNPDFAALEKAQTDAGANINKTILTVPEFRMAMSFAMDRDAFCLAAAPLNSAAFGLYSDRIIADPENVTAYRSTETAKAVLARFWGVSEEYGEGKLYENLDEAVNSITGYDPAKARELFDRACEIAVSEGLMDEDDVVQIKIGTPNNTAKFYNRGYEFIVNNYTEAVKGTHLEGKLVFTRDDTLGNSFGTALRNNQVDMLFGVGWSGSALDPYSLMEAYITPNYQYDDSVDYSGVLQTVTIDGAAYTASVADWYMAMMGETVSLTASDGTTMAYRCGSADGDPENRLKILGALEEAVLMNYNFIPIMDAATAHLKGGQVRYRTGEYLYGMEFGTLKYMTYDFSDREWDSYVAANGGELDYR